MLVLPMGEAAELLSATLEAAGRTVAGALDAAGHVSDAAYLIERNVATTRIRITRCAKNCSELLLTRFAEREESREKYGLL